ncbi:MAG: PPC domain-containing protein, partial [Gemmataceae bacterium]
FSFGHVAGGPDACSLLRLAAGPEVDSVPPLVQSPGGGECLVFGHGLPGGTQVAGRRDGLEQARLTLKPVGEEAEPLGGLASGLLPLRPFRFDGGPVIRLPVSDTVWVEGQEPADNNSADKAIPLTLPTVVAARLEKPGDRDFFSFEGKKGEPVWLELLGDRVGTRLDFVFTLKEAGETASREIDDGPEPLHNPWFFNRTEDPAILFTPPRDGVYQVGVSARDVNLGGAPHQVYALRVGPPRPDFRLVTIDPATQAGMPRLKPGTALSILVLADRTGGLNAPIEVVPEGLPPGVQALPCVIPSGQKGAWLTLVGGEGMTEAVWTLNLIGICQPSKDGEILKRSARHASPAYP